MKILPVIQTYEPDKSYLQQLLAAYPFTNEVFLRPVFQIDVLQSGISGEYLELLNSVQPQVIAYHKHDYSNAPGNNICDVGMDALTSAARISADLYIFIEGDTLISSKINDFVRDLSIPDNMGLLTLYSPGNGYANEESRHYPIYKFPGEWFYGIQCVMFTAEVVADLVAHRDELNTIPGYNDIRWKEYLLKTKREFYAAHKSYAQHIGSDKTHKAASPCHTTNIWVEN